MKSRQDNAKRQAELKKKITREDQIMDRYVRSMAPYYLVSKAWAERDTAEWIAICERVAVELTQNRGYPTQFSLPVERAGQYLQ